MLLSEKKIWKIVSREMLYLQNMDKYSEKEQVAMTALMKVKIQKTIAD